jgi:hypothetical protein
MTATIVDSVMENISPHTVNTLALELGGTTSAVQFGLRAGVASLMNELANYPSASPFMQRLYALAHKLRPDNENFAGIHAGLPATELTSMLLGNQQAVIEKAVGRHSGIGAYAGSDLLAAITPLTVGELGQRIYRQELDVPAFARLVRAEAARMRGMLPSGTLRMSGPIPVSLIAPQENTKQHSITKELLLVGGALVLSLAMWPLSGGCNKPKPMQATPVQTDSGISLLVTAK